MSKEHRMRAEIYTLEMEKEQLVYICKQLLTQDLTEAQKSAMSDKVNKLKTSFDDVKYNRYKDAELKFGSNPF